MDRRSFIQNLAAGTAVAAAPKTSAAAPAPDISGYTLVAEFSGWKVHEDLRTRDGAIVFADAGPQHLGLSMDDVGRPAPDPLADALLAGGDDPDPDKVRSAAPPLGSASGPTRSPRGQWHTFIGTKEAYDVTPVYPAGSTRTYHPVQAFPDLKAPLTDKRLEGLVGGWMPGVRKLFHVDDSTYYELILFGDVDAKDIPPSASATRPRNSRECLPAKGCARWM